MKKLILSVFAIAMISFASQAQEVQKEKEKRHDRKHHQKEMIGQKMNFTEDQKAQMKSIREESMKQLQELKKNDQITVKEYRERKKIIHDQQHTKMQALMTPDQKKKMDEMKLEHKNKAKNKSKREKITTL